MQTYFSLKISVGLGLCLCIGLYCISKGYVEGKANCTSIPYVSLVKVGESFHHFKKSQGGIEYKRLNNQSLKYNLITGHYIASVRGMQYGITTHMHLSKSHIHTHTNYLLFKYNSEDCYYYSYLLS